MMKKKLIMLIAVMAIVSLVFVGCVNTPAETEEEPVLNLGYVQWACANANSHMLEVLLEEKFDVQVDLKDMDAGLLWQSLATGDIDFMVTAWLPATHAEYREKVKDDVVVLSPLYEDAKLGLVVPQYVTIDSIAELNDNVEQFDGKIVGIDAGAGMMAQTRAAIDDLGLNYELMDSSGAAMVAELKAAYDANEWIVVTGWAPHFMFSEFDLKFLEDPTAVYGESETIAPVTRLDFGDDYPEINAFLDNYFMTPEQFGGLIAMMEDYDDDSEAARVWLDENQELVDSWFN